MIYFRITSSGEIEKYEVTINSDGLQEAKDESILNCGKKVRRSFTTTSSCISGKYYLNVTRKYAGIKSYTVGPDVELYAYEFIECEKTYLSTLIDRILNGDLSALVEIYKEDLSKEFNGLEEEIKNQEEKVQGTTNIDQKIKEIEKLKELYLSSKLNSDRKDISRYYVKAASMIDFKRIGTIKLEDYNRVMDFIDGEKLSYKKDDDLVLKKINSKK